MQESVARPGDPPVQILVVEDERLAARDLGCMLEELGHVVCGYAVSGQDALEKARTTRPDLVLMDVSLEGPIDGTEAAKLISSELDCSIVFVTGLSDSITLARAKTAEPAGYLLKPFRAHELKVLIEVVMHKHRLERARKNEAAITRAELERRVAVQAAELAAAHRELSSLAQSIAHETRNPLNAIHGFSQLLEFKIGIRPDQEAPVELAEIRRAARRIDDLVENMQLLSFVHAKDLVFEDVDMSELAIHATAFIRPPERVTVQAGMRALADKELLTLAWERIVSHAVQEAKRSNDLACFNVGSVSLDGKTQFFIERVDAPRANERPSSTTPRKLHAGALLEGSGISLAIVQHVLERHGGTVWVVGEDTEAIYFTVG